MSAAGDRAIAESFAIQRERSKERQADIDRSVAPFAKRSELRAARARAIDESAHQLRGGKRV